MDERFRGKRFAYVKSSNAAEELRQVTLTPSSIPDGPLTFITQFLTLFGKEKGPFRSETIMPYLFPKQNDL